MKERIQFNDDQNSVTPSAIVRDRTPKLISFVIDSGITKTAGAASGLLVAFALLLIAASVVILMSRSPVRQAGPSIEIDPVTGLETLPGMAPVPAGEL